MLTSSNVVDTGAGNIYFLCHFKNIFKHRCSFEVEVDYDD